MNDAYYNTNMPDKMCPVVKSGIIAMIATFFLVNL